MEAEPTMKAIERFVKGDMHGIHYAVSMFIATTVLWLLSTKFSIRRVTFGARTC
jgi:hypothetical protein